MKRTLFDMIARQIMIEDDSLYASRLHLSIDAYRLKREIDRLLTPIFLPIVKWIDRQIYSTN